MKQKYTLPDGRIIKEKIYYKFYKAIEKDLEQRGFFLHGFDPGILFYDKEIGLRSMQSLAVSIYSKLVNKDFYKECGL